jgi:ATP-dependent Clp protease ATP-binding subunit ClpA
MSDEAILSVEMEIKAVSVKLDELEAAIKDARAAQDKDEVAALRKNEEQLRKKEEQLRKKEEQLRAEKLLLLARQPGALCPSPQFMWRLAFTRAAVVLSGRSSSGFERGSPPEAASALALAAVVAC